MNRDQAIELLRKHAKAKPESYYAEPFMPHEWAIDAVMAASSDWRLIDQRIPMQDQPHPEPYKVVLVWVNAISYDDEDGSEADASECDLGQYVPPSREGGDGHMENFQGQIGSNGYISHWMPLPAQSPLQQEPATQLIGAIEDYGQWLWDAGYSDDTRPPELTPTQHRRSS